MRWPVKLVLQTGIQKSHFCVRPWSLLTILNFSNGGRQTQRCFNVSAPSSRRENKVLSLDLDLKIIFNLRNVKSLSIVRLNLALKASEVLVKCGKMQINSLLETVKLRSF